MSAKIFQFQNYKEIEFIDIRSHGKETIFDVLFIANGIPYILKNLKIEEIFKDKVKYQYGSIFHSKDLSSGECPFCHKDYQLSDICVSLTDEKVDIFSKHLSKYVFFPIIAQYYNKDDTTFFDNLHNNRIDSLNALFFGVAEDKYIQCIFEYKDEILVYQDVLEPGDLDTIPLIFYFNEDKKSLHLYVEYLMPEVLIPITNAINREINKPNVEISDTTGVPLIELYLEILNRP